jgi:hypothetical protein
MELRTSLYGKSEFYFRDGKGGAVQTEQPPSDTNLVQDGTTINGKIRG